MRTDGVDADVLTRAAANCGEAYRAWAEGLGRPWRTWDDLVVADLGLPVPAPPNHASVLAPLTSEHLDDALDRLSGFFDGSRGGPYQLWSLWPTPDLSRFGFDPWRSPMMLRPAGGEPRPRPAELEIVEVGDARSAAEAESVLTAFGIAESDAKGTITPALNRDDFRVWLGRVEGRAAATATASVSHGFVGVYAVATLPAFRGRGYGEALSWTATTFRAELPATLQASAMGYPVYERMGYRAAATFHCWQIPRSPGQRTR